MPIGVPPHASTSRSPIATATSNEPPIVSPDFVKLADAYDIPGIAVRRPGEVVAAYELAHRTPGPFLIDFRVKEEVNVYPMIAPGAAVDELIRRPKPGVVQGYSGIEPSW